jgi:hypothetical protein
VYDGLPHSKKPRNKKRDDDEPMGRPYKKTKAERGVKFNKREKSAKSKPKGKSGGGGGGKPRGKPNKRR